ncbi:D-3-phosphoglycerate dehydrogenase-like [Pecten maximus]|uniref:D-3-phosphoglycerate dehydrogenase-like n=1 Tax=Pecten maximus TaxID=6579 RepID=UPI00145864BE|nr:D-3-phosphoglycerate dehydrogenase-like [Pecten maximus]
MSFTLNSVLITDEIDQKCLDVLKSNGINVVKNTKLSKDELLVEIAKYDGLVVRSATKVTADVIEAATNLKIIGRAGTGVDNIDCDAASRKGIIVMNTPGGNTLSAAEHTCALICASSRHVHQGDRAMKGENWGERKKLMGSELYGKTLAIIGLGRIGKEVALRMQSFGMTTIGFDPIIPGSVSAEFDVEWMKLEDIWPKADYITVHTPLIPQTRNLINDKVFSLCKRGVRVINVARGGIIEEEALLRALESGQCGGAGIDVYSSEPPKDFSLAKHKNVVATPHLGASTVEAQQRVAVEIAEQFVDLVQGKKLFGAVNAPALTNAMDVNTLPWIELGKKLGVVAAAVNDQNQQFSVVLYGSTLGKSAGSYMTAAVLSGLIQNSSFLGAGDSSKLNLVSAPALAKQYGINSTSTYEEKAPAPYNALVSVVFSNGFRVSGTTSGGQALLVEIQNQTFSSPACLCAPVIIFRGNSNSQLIPSVAGALAGAGVTITSLNTSSETDGQKWGVATFATTPSEGCLEALKSLVTAARLIVL